MWVSTALRPGIEVSSLTYRFVFQSRCGFLPPCDHTGSETSEPIRNIPVHVSIPMWVSTALRLSFRVEEVGELLLRLIGVAFQSRCGFLPPCDGPGRSGREARTGRFNPDVGFYRLATIAITHPVAKHVTVSIPMWVSTALRHDKRPRHRPGDRVSIPMWVSTALRRATGVLADELVRGRRHPSCFNPDVGFYRLATGSGTLLFDYEDIVSIPMWVSTALRPAFTLDEFPTLLFQSRCGFLPPCDRSWPVSTPSARCFNPDVGFYRLATRYGRGSNRQTIAKFQSRCGFLPPCDP